MIICLFVSGIFDDTLTISMKRPKPTVEILSVHKCWAFHSKFNIDSKKYCLKQKDEPHC